MNRIISTVGASLALVLATAGIASAAPRNVPSSTSSYDYGYSTVAKSATDPSCPGTYDHVTTVYKYGSAVTLSTGNNLVYINAGGSSVKTGSGADCVVVNSDGNYVSTDGGRDFIQNNGNGSSLISGAANDTINDNGLRNYLNGGTGTDTCNYDFNSSYGQACEL